MTDSSAPPTMRRNVRLYPWYAAAFNAHAWLPVFFLYFSEKLALAQVLQLEAIYYLGVVLLEVPSGYFSDRAGRRITLLISASAIIVAYGLFYIGSSFEIFVAAQLFLAGGFSFRSGTDTSFHYDSVVAAGIEDEFGAREAVASRNSFLASALAALLGGAVGSFDLSYAYLVSMLFAGVSLVIVFAFSEPVSEDTSSEVADGIGQQFVRCARYLRQPSLFWLFSFSVVMTVLNHVPYEFYQPYIGLLGEKYEALKTGTPMLSGFHLALTMLIASWFSAKSVSISERIGTGPTLMLSTILQILIIGVMGFWIAGWVAAVVLLRSAPRALMTAPLNAAVAPRISKEQRATYLSIQSLVGRLSFAGFLVILSSLAGEDTSTWTSLSDMLQTSALFGLVTLVILAGAMRFCLKPVKE